MSYYKKLADLNIDEIEPVAVSEIEKKRVKQHVMGVGAKKKIKVFKYMAVAATIALGAAIGASFAVPSLASQIPFMNNIMNYFKDENSYTSNYSKFATSISQTQSSNGVSIMIEDAVFDGSSITVSYAIETDKDLGTSPGMSSAFNVKGAVAIGAAGTIKKVNDTKYVGTEKITPTFRGSKPDRIEISWEPGAFKNLETDESIAGDWHFAFEVSALENKSKLVNQYVTNHGVTVNIKSIETNGLSTVIHYEQVVEARILDKWPHVTAEIKSVQDDLGNSYSVDGNGGVSRDNGVSFEWSSTIKSIHPNAKSLTLVPVIYYSLGSGRGLETKEMAPITIELK
ncbi:DUF4179 domain-containing protein [Neobacillus sp. GCM10023253]|uniref:DUF4179 domain-containing protein n=1 Tax=Neobacillus sp. GCM10023253 TaxID=3252644 RepID=UPI0036138BBA